MIQVPPQVVGVMQALMALTNENHVVLLPILHSDRPTISTVRAPVFDRTLSFRPRA